MNQKESSAQSRSASEQTFAGISGHRLIQQYFSRAVANRVLPHAMLFHGPEGVGKMSMAYALAKLINCPRASSDFCGCDTCRKIRDGVFADIMLVQPKGAAGQITLAGWKPGKDDLEGLQYYRFIDSRPIEGGRKFLLFRQAERMNPAVANFLLKLIEEPPSYLTIILTTHRPAELLTTIRSRCTPVKFSPLTLEEMGGFALACGCEKKQGIDELIRLAEGRPGLLLALLEGNTAGRNSQLGFLMRLFQDHGFVALFRVASELAGASGSGRSGGVVAVQRFEEALNSLQTWLRDAMIVKTVSDETAQRLLLNRTCVQDLKSYACQSPLESLAVAAAAVRSAYPLGSRQIDKQYVLETLLLQIGRGMRLVKSRQERLAELCPSRQAALGR